MIPFKYAGHDMELDKTLELVERLESLAYQAELGFWDAARAEFDARGYVSHKPRTLAAGLCAVSESVCNEILERIAFLSGDTHTALDWSSNQNTLYAGSTDLELEVVEPEQQVIQPTAGIAAVGVTVQTGNVPTEEKNKPKPRIASALAVTKGLREQLKWAKEWLRNSSSPDTLQAYMLVLAQVYDYADALIGSIGPNFATPLTAFYSLPTEDTGLSLYVRPQVGAEFSAANEMSLTCINNAAFECPQGGTTGFNQIVANDYIHVMKLEVPGYEDFVDKIYKVKEVVLDGTDEIAVTLYVPSDSQLPLVMSEYAKDFNTAFLLRKVRGVAA